MKRNYKAKFMVPALLFFLSGCAASAQISRSAKAALLNDPAIATGHIGISIYEPATGKYWYNYNDTKNFIPASNTKLFTLYAGMKYLGDSLTGLRYRTFEDSTIFIYATGDPTFLHPGFKQQPVLDFLLKQRLPLRISARLWKEEAWGNGWSWNDYEEDYMAERSDFPLHGNTVTVKLDSSYWATNGFMVDWKTEPVYFTKLANPSAQLPGVLVPQLPITDTNFLNSLKKLSPRRKLNSNIFYAEPGNSNSKQWEMTYSTAGNTTAVEILRNDFGLNIRRDSSAYSFLASDPGKTAVIKSQPVDSLFKPMMHRSDNFFAEQTLLMVSNEKLGYMNDEAIIDTILKTDLKDIPQKPRWVDGCGLSRYNLFTPRSFVYILDKMRTEFGMERLKNILATGGTGTLSAYYKKDSGYIFAKTGTLSNNCALSGYLITQKDKLLLFSVLVNNYQSPAAPVRRAVERFLQGIRQKN